MQKLCFYFLLQLWVPLRYRCSWPMRYRCSTNYANKPTGSRSPYRRGQGFESRTSLSFFKLSFGNCKSYVYNDDDLPSHNSSLCSSHIWFSYIYNFIIILSRVYNEPIQRPAHSWPVSLIRRALHRYRRGQGSNPVQAWIFFRLSFRNCKVAYITGMIFLHIIQSYHALRRFSAYILKRQKRTVLSFVTFVPSTVWVHRCAMRHIFSLIMVITFVQGWLCVSECIVNNRATQTCLN